MLYEKLKLHEQSLLPHAEVPSGVFYGGDTLELLPMLTEEYGERLKLIYLDPPFMTGRNFNASVQVGGRGYKGDRKYIDTVPLYSDSWESRDAYLAFLKQIFCGAHKLLRNDGIMCVHVDRRVSAHVRLLLDDVFGEKCFINEIIWHYRSGGSSKNSFAAKHDTLFLFGKTPNVKINTSAVGEIRGTEIRNHLKKQTDDDGRVFFSIKSAGREYRYYEDELIPYDDVWEISHLQQKHPERTGYGTQKPIELLNRIVLSCSQEGDIVGDLFAGSGTTLISAHRNGRKYLGVDKAKLSLHTFRQRLLEEGETDAVFVHSLPVDDSVCVSIDKTERSDCIQVMLSGYSFNKRPEMPQYDDGREYISYWAVGTMNDNEFTVEDCSSRSANAPQLRKTLTTDTHGTKAVYICDAYGNHRLIKI